MADAFPLPIEILGLVISNLAIQRQLKALTSLLRVNKYVCLATLPILYGDPFVWFVHREQDRQNFRSHYSHTAAVPVIRLLFASLPKDSYSGLLKAMYKIGDATELPGAVTRALEDLSVANDSSSSLLSTLQCWPIDYLSYVRHFNAQDQNGQSVLADLDDHEMAPRLKSYVEEHKLAETYAAVALKIDRGWGNRNDSTTVDYLKLNIHRETTWALCSPILEQLQSIIIPLSEINRYLDLITRFKSLAVVTFKLDELADINHYYLETMNAEHVKQVNQRKEKRRQDLELAVQFVQIHTTIFRGTLKQVLCPEDWTNWQRNVQYCPADILDRMLAFLSTLIEPTELVNKNWKQFVAKAEHTNLEHVTNIDVWYQYVEDWYDQLKSKPFLQRCTSLRKYNMISLGPDSFKWAAQNDHSDYGKDQGHHEALPPLEDVSIHAKKEHFGSELDDIGLAFGPILKSFSIQGFRYQPSPGGRQLLSIGRGWKMPALSRFEVNSPSEEIELDPDFLRHCPSLRTLILDDDTRTYDLNKIQVSHPAHLPELTKLLLVGTGALSFHPDTLHSTRELQILYLGSRKNFHRTFLPSLEAMEQADQPIETTSGDFITTPVIHRPKWTWDWYLPNMTMLNLSVEFSLHFRFQMLRGAPKLEDLSLSLYSTAHQVERILTEADFILESWDQVQKVGFNGDNDIQQEQSSSASSSSSSSNDLEEPTLHAQSLIVLSTIHSYLDQLTADRQDLLEPVTSVTANRPAVQEAEQQQDQPQLTEQQLQRQRERRLRMSREVNMMHTHYPMHMGLHERPAQPCTRHPGGCPDQTQEHIAEAVAGIKDLVAKHNLQTQLDKMLRDVRALKLKRQREKQAMAQLRAEHPEQLVAPSVKKLEIYGRWVMSDAVLETLLTRVFRNVWQLNECLTSGYSMDAFVRVTQSMPWLERVKSINLFDPDSLSEGYKLQTARERTMRPPFLSDAANRVIYNFEPPHLQMIRGDGSGEPAKVDVEVEEATEVIFAD